MQNFSLRTRLQNIICSEQFCGLCFADTTEISTDVVLEVASDEWSHIMRLGDIYGSVFKESIEDLASKIICSNCTDHLIQSYTFIQNTKLTSQSLNKYLNNLQEEILQLNNYENIEFESENICIILADENKVRIDTRNNKKELHCKLCKMNFGTLQNFLNHFKAHSRYKHETLKEDMRTDLKLKNLQSDRMSLKSIDPRSLETQKSNLEVRKKYLEKNKKIHEIQTEIIKKSHDTTDINKTVSDTDKSNKVLIREIQCVMCLEDIGDQDHLCEFKCRDKEVFLEHVDRCHLNQYKCDLCGQNLRTKMAIQTDFSSSHFDCMVLNVQAFGKMQESKNRQIHIQGADIIESIKNFKPKKISCDKCQRCFDNVTTLQHHQKSHLEVIKCDKDTRKLRGQLKIPSNGDLKCIKKVNKNIKCELCGYITWNSILLECHMNRYHLKIKPYICHICSKNFIGKHLLKKHIKTHTVDQSIICNFCGKKLAV